MASNALPSSLSALMNGLSADNGFPNHILSLTESIAFNLKNEHEWSAVKIHFLSPLNPSHSLPRPLISGIPRARVYVHPDDQIEELARRKRGEPVNEKPPREWVIPSHLKEKWSLKQFAGCFDAVGQEPPDGDNDPEAASNSVLEDRRGGKRMILATLNDDSTVVYYVVHDGIVKPRQN